VKEVEVSGSAGFGFARLHEAIVAAGNLVANGASV
jgi:hypothetical protein